MRLRNRIVKATYYTDPDLCRMPRDKREFYRSLWACAEDSCCLEDDMFGVKLAAWPSPMDADMTVEKFEAWRDEFVATGRLVAYQSGGNRFLYIPTMAEHESPRNPQSPDCPLPEWVEWIPPAKGTRGSYRHHTDAVQTLYRPDTDPPVLSCTGLSCTELSATGAQREEAVEKSANAPLSNLPDCLSFTAELDGRTNTLRGHLLTELERHLGAPWVMRPANLGKLGTAIRAGCPPACPCDEPTARRCASAFITHAQELATKAAAEGERFPLNLWLYRIREDGR